MSKINTSASSSMLNDLRSHLSASFVTNLREQRRDCTQHLRVGMEGEPLVALAFDRELAATHEGTSAPIAEV